MFPTTLRYGVRYRARVPLRRFAPYVARGGEAAWPRREVRWLPSFAVHRIATGMSVLMLDVAWAGTPVPVIDQPGGSRGVPARIAGLPRVERCDESRRQSFVRPDGAPKIQMNPAGTASAGGGSTARLPCTTNSRITGGGRQPPDVRRADAGAQRSAGRREHSGTRLPALDLGDWLLFTRDNFRTAGSTPTVSE